eukprot:SAG11_NODE_488_length_8997_cov_12.304113_1_plen_126_part_00
MHSDGPFAVTKVHADKIHFEIDMPEWMQRSKDNRFTIKSIKAIKEEHPNPTAGVRDAVENDAGGAEELLEGNFVITELWARRYDVKKKRYEYKVLCEFCGRGPDRRQGADERIRREVPKRKCEDG